ncbi:flavoprotein [Kitasatospora sp. NPDC002227]|uniref:flavoprotein n=1 Tax=Kitasatospora sp. NPDC002227 TaxID=3154773 RepID=UPI00332AE756
MGSDRVLYLLGSAAPAVLDLPAVIERAQTAGWNVCLGLTSSAAAWLREDFPALEELTGRPIRHRHRIAGELDPWPPASAALVAPATFNTINSWALGLTSEWLVAFAAEAIGKRIPLVLLPSVNSALAAHPQFDRSLETLRGAGVRVLYGEDEFAPHAPKQGNPAKFPWDAGLAAIEQAWAERQP